MVNWSAVENPPGFLVRTECEKAAWDNGWRISRDDQDGWIIRESHDAPGRIALAAAGAQGPWFLGVDHAGVALELDGAIDMHGPGVARFAFPNASTLYQAISRVYDLAKALPDDPLRQFQTRTGSMPRSTEEERKVVARVGQDIFRDALMRFWEGRCPLTGITDPALLRASHIKPWAECETDAERLDVYNGLLLSALWDAAFDRFLVTLSAEGNPDFSSALSSEARACLQASQIGAVKLSDKHLVFLAHHREKLTQGQSSG